MKTSEKYEKAENGKWSDDLFNAAKNEEGAFCEEDWDNETTYVCFEDGSIASFNYCGVESVDELPESLK
jgi:hypothetical protein